MWFLLEYSLSYLLWGNKKNPKRMELSDRKITGITLCSWTLLCRQPVISIFQAIFSSLSENWSCVCLLTIALVLDATDTMKYAFTMLSLGRTTMDSICVGWMWSDVGKIEKRVIINVSKERDSWLFSRDGPYQKKNTFWPVTAPISRFRFDEKRKVGSSSNDEYERIKKMNRISLEK